MEQPKHITSKSTADRLSTTRRPEVRGHAALFTKEVESIVGYLLATQTNEDQTEFTFERWDRTLDTIFVNPARNTIRFGMRASGMPGIDDEPFQVVLRNGPEGWIFKCDHWDEADFEYPLEVFESPHAILFLLTGSTGHIYLHIESRAETPIIEVTPVKSEATILRQAFSILGKRTSKKKAASSRKNGRLGGRPKGSKNRIKRHRPVMIAR